MSKKQPMPFVTETVIIDKLIFVYNLLISSYNDLKQKIL